MARQATKARGNRYCEARLEAAKYNPAFATRSGAAEAIDKGISEDSLKKYELDITIPPSDVVALMADAYAEPGLRSWYCANECPLGRNERASENSSIEQTSIRLHNHLGSIEDAISIIFNAVEDGIVTEAEWKAIQTAADELMKMKQFIGDMLVAVERNSKHRAGGGVHN